MKIRKALMFTGTVLLPIILGTMIYVGWRTTSLLVFEWMAIFGIPNDILRPTLDLPPAIRYSLPDGFWVLAGTSWMFQIWQRSHPWVFVIVALAIGSEIGQAMDLVPGTFAWMDILFYVSGFVLAIMLNKYEQTSFFNLRTTSDGDSCCR